MWPRLVLTWLDTFHYIRTLLLRFDFIIPSFIFYMYHHYPLLSFKQIEFAHSDLTLLKAKEQGIILRTYSVTLLLTLILPSAWLRIKFKIFLFVLTEPILLREVRCG